jgi:protein-S-isoprenylcysteine O-methyltransferase Ste14
MAGVALGLYVVWAVLAFGWRTVVQYRRTGDSGLRLGAEPGTATWWAKLGFIVAIVVGFAAPVSAKVGLGNIAAFDAAWLRAVGVGVSIVGIVMTVIAQFAMGNSWRIGVDNHERTTLVTAGVFSLVRNPIFTSMLVTSFGLLMMIPNVLSVAGFVLLIVALEVQVRLVEEPYLVSAQGDDYRAYARRVGRFTPGLGRLRSGGPIPDTAVLGQVPEKAGSALRASDRG